MPGPGGVSVLLKSRLLSEGHQGGGVILCVLCLQTVLCVSAAVPWPLFAVCNYFDLLSAFSSVWLQQQCMQQLCCTRQMLSSIVY